jgi:hypothetical protein
MVMRSPAGTESVGAQDGLPDFIFQTVSDRGIPTIPLMTNMKPFRIARSPAAWMAA